MSETIATSPVSSQTRWAAVSCIVIASIASALHVGKATIAIPWLQQEFDASMALLSWVMSAFPMVGVFGGIIAGVLVRNWGDRRLLLLGLLILGIASIAGAQAPSFAWLLGTRFIEGLGFMIVVVAAPALLNRVTSEDRHNMVFGLWSTFMAGGIALSMLFGPMLGGWRGNWYLTGGLVLAAALSLSVFVKQDKGIPQESSGQRLLPALRQVLGAWSTHALALGFTSYNILFFALMAFLPSFLMQRLGISVAAAGLISAAIVAANILGNLGAGRLLSQGLRPGWLVAATAAAMGCMGAGIFLDDMPATLVVVLCFAFSAVAGIMPATILATAPATAPIPSLAPLSIGWVVQGNYLGQVLGPLLIGTVVGAGGWSAAILLMLVVAIAGVALGLAFDRLDSAQKRER